MQSTASARSAPGFNSGPIVATVFGIPAAVMVVAALDDASLPIGNDGLIWPHCDDQIWPHPDDMISSRGRLLSRPD